MVAQGLNAAFHDESCSWFPRADPPPRCGWRSIRRGCRGRPIHVAAAAVSARSPGARAVRQARSARRPHLERSPGTCRSAAGDDLSVAGHEVPGDEAV